MIFCQELNKSFDNKEELFKELSKNEQIILDQKKSEIYNSKEWCKTNGIKGVCVSTNQKLILKSLSNETNKGLEIDDNHYYFATNTANFLDSHLDVHVDGNWNKTVKEAQGNVYLLFDHELNRNEIIAMKQDIELMTAYISWASLGKNYDGETYALIYKVRKDKIVNKQAREWLEAGYSFEASVRMQYIKIEVAYNSEHEDYKKEKKVFDTYYPLIVNKDDFAEITHFYVVKEAKNIKESSLVMFGSNSATGLIQQKENIDPSKDTHKIIKEAVNDTSQVNKSYFLI